MTLSQLVPNLRKIGSELHGPCPFCGEGDDRFIVWPDEGREERGRYLCRKCGKTGDVIDFLQARDGIGYVEACDRLRIDTDAVLVPVARAEPSPDFWNAERREALREAQGRLRTETGHALLAMAKVRDGLEAETMAAFGCGLISDARLQRLMRWRVTGRDWLILPYRTGAQLYRRDAGDKEVYSLIGSDPKGSFFGSTRLQGRADLFVTKSPREAMLLAQTFPEIDVIGLPGGEKAELSVTQAAFLRSLEKLDSVRVLLDCDAGKDDDFKPRMIARAFAADVAAAVHPVSVGLVDVTAATDGAHKDITDVWRAAGVEAAAEVVTHGDIIEPRKDDATDAKDGDEEPEPPSLSWKPLPLDTLPDAVERFVRAHGAAIGCDPAFAAVPALAVLSAAVGTRFRIRLKNSWHETATLWTGTVAPSGSAKSPAWEAALQPVRKLEAESASEHRDAMIAYQEAEEAFKAQPKAERDASRRPVQPVRRRYAIADATIESVIDRHAHNPGGLLVARDEGAGWISGMDRYSRGSGDMQSWIELRDGRPVTVDRKTGDTKTYSISRPAVAVTFTIQPSVLSSVLTPAHFHSGFAARLVLSMPPPTARRWTDADVSSDVDQDYETLIRRLNEREIPGENDDVPAVEMSPKARDMFANFVNENGRFMQSMPDGPLRSALAKIEATAARLALTFHLCDHVMGPARHGTPGVVPGPTMDRAVRLTRWIRYETARLYSVLRFEERAQTEDDKLISRLPAAFRWQDVAQAAGVKRRAAYDIIRRLIDTGRAESLGSKKNQYRSVCTLHKLHELHIESNECGNDVQNVQSVQCAEDDLRTWSASKE